jgi:hypothetical protein
MKYLRSPDLHRSVLSKTAGMVVLPARTSDQLSISLALFSFATETSSHGFPINTSVL